MPQVFLSYVHEDFERAEKLALVLELYRIKVWLDKNSLKPGYRWKKAIRDGIRSGDFFIALFSSASTSRRRSYMNEELTLAIGELRQRPSDRAWFLPVLLDDVELPDRDIGAGESICSIQAVHLFDDWIQGVKSLLTVISPDSARLYELSETLRSTSARSRIKAVDELGKLGELALDAVPLLTNVLNDENETARAAAADALGKIGSRTNEVIDQLSSVAASGDYYPARHARSALAALQEKGVESLLQIAPAAAAQDATSLPALLNELRRGNRQVISEMGRLGSLAREAIPALREVNTEESTIALGLIGDPSAVPELIKRIKGDDYWGRYHAAKALEQIADSSAVPALISAIQTKDAALARAASDAILAIGTPEAIESITPLLLIQLTFSPPVDSDGHIIGNAVHLRANAARVLGEIGEQAFVPALLPLLPETRTVFKEVASALLKIGTPEAVVAVAAAAVNRISSTDNFERATSAELLGRIGDPSHRSILVGMLGDAESVVRTRAKVALRRMSALG